MSETLAAPLPSRSFKFRPHDWMDTDNLQPKFGIQVCLSPALEGESALWMHAHSGGIPLIFDTAAERDATIARLRSDKRL